MAPSCLIIRREQIVGSLSRRRLAGPLPPMSAQWFRNGFVPKYMELLALGLVFDAQQIAIPVVVRPAGPSPMTPASAFDDGSAPWRQQITGMRARGAFCLNCHRSAGPRL